MLEALITALVAMAVVGGLLVRQRRLVRRIEQLSKLDVVSHQLASNLSIEDVLETIYSQVSQIVTVNTYYIALCNDTLNTFEFPFAIENYKRVQWMPMDASRARLTEYVVKQKDTVYVHDANRELFTQMGRALHEDYRSFVGFPLIAGDKTLGALCLASHQPDAFSSSVLEMMQTLSRQAALSLRNAVLYDRSIEMSGNLARINNFVQGIVFNTEVTSVMRSACEVAVQIAHADRAAVFYQDSENAPTISLSYALNLLPEHQTWLQIHRYSRDHLPSASITYFDVTTLGDDYLSTEGVAGEFRSKAEIPMRSGNSTIGVLVIYYIRPHYYLNAELELLETLVYQIAAALDNVELLKTLEAYASEQAQLVHLSRISTSTLELRSVIQTVANLLKHMLVVDRVHIGLVDKGYETIHLYSDDQRDDVPFDAIRHLLTHDTVPQETPFSAIALELQRVLVFPPHTFLLSVPLIVGQEVTGLIIVSAVHSFRDTDKRLLELAANQVGVQLFNAQQYQLIQEALDRRLRQLALIEDIARQISSALNVDQLIGNVLDAAIKATQADMAALALITEMGEFQIIGRESRGESWIHQQVTRETTEGIMGQVVLSKKTLIVPNNSQSKDYLSTLSHGRYHSSLVVPLLKDHVVIGVLNIESTQIDYFKEEHAEFIESLAGHAVISIQNARLLQERQRQIEVLTNLRKLSLRLSSNTDRRSMANEILQTALTILKGEHAVLFRYAEDTTTLVSSLRRTDKGFNTTSVPLPESIAYCAAETGEVQIVSNVQESDFYKGYPYLQNVDYAALIAAPIKHGNQIQEVLCVTFARQRTHIQDDLNTLELLLIQAAGHLENAVLYERVVAGNDRLRTFLDSSSEGIILLDAQGNLVQANVSAERLLGVDLTDYIGDNFATRLLEVLEADESNTDAHEGLRNMARILRLEPERIIRRRFELRGRGQPTYIEEVSSPVMDGQHRSMGRLLILRDVTEEKLLEDYRNEITNMIVHDLRSPLSAIYSGLSYSRFLIDDPQGASDANEVLVPVLDVALNSTNSLLSLVDSLLDIAKLETRSMPLKKRACDLYTIVQDIATSMAPLVKEAEIQLQLHVSPELPQVYVDESKIRRVIVNLLDNAQRFSPQGGAVLVEAVLLTQEHRVLMRVADSGKGIPPEERERVFEKFRQVMTNTPERGRRGSGLGLTFCKLVLEAHGERIWVEAESPLSGASFAFTMPVVMKHQAT